jgi:histone H3/H4
MIISQDSKAAFQQVSGFFILYIFSLANDVSKENKRQKVMP